MKKKPYLTYEQKRTCLECSAPLADQTHGLRKFCPRVKHADGYIDHCKDRYNSRLKQIDEVPYKRLMAFYRDITRKIEALEREAGEEVTVEQVNRAGIPLEHHLLRKVGKEGLMTYYFVEHVLEKQADQTFKIYSYELF